MMKEKNPSLILAFCSLTFVLVVCSTASAQVPRTVSVQGVLFSEDGSTRPDGQYNVVFSLYDSETEPEAAWSEAQAVTVTNGVFTVYLGEVEPISVDFDRPFWLGTSVNGEEETAPRIRLSAVPYAFMARAVEDGAVSGSKIADGHVVRSLNGLRDDVTLVDGDNVLLETRDDTLIVSSTALGDGHSLDAVDGSETDVVFVDAQGRVGVGTTSPRGRLHVSGNIELEDVNPFVIFRGAGSTRGFSFYQGDEVQPEADLFWSNTHGLRAALTSAATSSWVLARNGNFGIGFPGGTNPSEKLDVDGNIRLTGIVVQASDRRLKQEIRDLSYGLEEMMKLRPVSYRDRARSESVRFGLIANDVQDVIPEVVRHPVEEGGYLGLSYTELVPILIKAIQEQQAEIEDLRMLLSGILSESD